MYLNALFGLGGRTWSTRCDLSALSGGQDLHTYLRVRQGGRSSERQLQVAVARVATARADSRDELVAHPCLP
jgi:hypothetical protein